jgi:hypothetical protein
MQQFLKSPGSKIVIFCLLIVALFGWSTYTRREKPLFMGIRSGLSTSQFLSSCPWTTYSTKTDGPVTTLVFDDITFESFKGRVSIDFYQDEVMSISFSPQKYDAFVRRFLKPSPGNSRNFEFNAGGVTVMGYADEHGPKVTWQDAARYSDLVQDIWAHA